VDLELPNDRHVEPFLHFVHLVFEIFEASIDIVQLLFDFLQLGVPAYASWFVTSLSVAIYIVSSYLVETRQRLRFGWVVSYYFLPDSRKLTLYLGIYLFIPSQLLNYWILFHYRYCVGVHLQ